MNTQTQTKFINGFVCNQQNMKSTYFPVLPSQSLIDLSNDALAM